MSAFRQSSCSDGDTSLPRAQMDAEEAYEEMLRQEREEETLRDHDLSDLSPSSPRRQSQPAATSVPNVSAKYSGV